MYMHVGTNRWNSTYLMYKRVYMRESDHVPHECTQSHDYKITIYHSFTSLTSQQNSIVCCHNHKDHDYKQCHIFIYFAYSSIYQTVTIFTGQCPT